MAIVYVSPPAGYEGILPLSDACVSVKEDEASCKGNFLTTVQLKNNVFLRRKGYPPQVVRFQCPGSGEKLAPGPPIQELPGPCSRNKKWSSLWNLLEQKAETCYIEMYKDIKSNTKGEKYELYCSWSPGFVDPPFFNLEYGAYSKCNSVPGQLYNWKAHILCVVGH